MAQRVDEVQDILCQHAGLLHGGEMACPIGKPRASEALTQIRDVVVRNA